MYGQMNCDMRPNYLRGYLSDLLHANNVHILVKSNIL
jgi:hypothetical protein